jgi:hypothetical protein
MREACGLTHKLKEVEAMAEQQGLITSMRRSRVGFVAIVAAILTLGSLTEALANGKAHHHTSHLPRGWKAERDFGHGWGWDPRSGYYEGPFFGRKGKGYFRCFDPGYGWHSCPHYGALPERIDGGVASGIVGRDTDALSHALDKELVKRA